MIKYAIDDRPRCKWSFSSKKYRELYVNYHDTEWGVPCFTDAVLFEKLILESNQAGLSWITILVKRENFRRAYNNFDPHIIADYTDADVARLMQDEGIVRNRAKINAAISNSRIFLDIQNQHGNFSNYLWQFVDGEPVVNQLQEDEPAPVSSALSDTISKDLKKRGCKFTGTVMVYSYLQSLGIINDHWEGCYRFEECQKLRR